MGIEKYRVRTKQINSTKWTEPGINEFVKRTLSNFPFLTLFLTNPHWARVVGYGSFSLYYYVIHKEGLCPSSRDSRADDDELFF
jgi:hypothetical protein